MFRVSLLYLALLFLIPHVSVADSAAQLFQILQLVDQKKYDEAISGYEQYMQVAPPWFQGPIQFEIATLQAELGEKKEALSKMEEAIQSGFDDCFAVKQYPAWNAFQDNFQFATLHSTIRMTEADYKELAWLKSEIVTVHREASGNETVHVEIPTRQTTSAAVLFNRELLNVLQSQAAITTKLDTHRKTFSLPPLAGTELRACIELK